MNASPNNPPSSPETPWSEEESFDEHSAEPIPEAGTEPIFEEEDGAVVSGLANFLESTGSSAGHRLEETGTGLANTLRERGDGLAGRLEQARHRRTARIAEHTASGLANLVEHSASGLAYTVEQAGSGLAYAVDQTGLYDLVERKPSLHSRLGLLACLAGVAGTIMLGQALPMKGVAGVNHTLGFLAFLIAGCLLAATGLAMAAAALVRGETRRALPVAGLVLNSLAVAALAVLAWWPTPDHLVDAARRADAAAVQQALELNVDVNTREKIDFAGINEGATPLTAAAETGEIEIARLLIERGAEVNHRDGRFQTPLFLAVSQGDLAMARFLLEHGADPRVTAKAKSPLYEASIRGHQAMAALLLEYGAPVAPGTPDPFHGALEAGHLEVMRLLWLSGADPDQPDRKGHRPLHRSVHLGLEHFVPPLLAMGADPEAPDAAGRTAIDLAQATEQASILQALSDLGASEIPHVLIGRNMPEALRRLVERGGTDALEHRQLGLDPLQLAAFLGRARIVDLLLELGISPDHRPHAEAPTPLHLAAAGNRQAVLDRLLEAGADPDRVARMPTFTGPPLLAAYLNRHTPIAEELVLRGADPDVPGEHRADRGTALFFAARDGDLAFARWLLAGGADVNAQIPEAELSPLHAAVEGAHPRLVEWLITSGANPDSQEARGLTPLDLARLHRDRHPARYDRILALLTRAAE